MEIFTILAFLAVLKWRTALEMSAFLFFPPLNFYPFHELLHKAFALLLAAGSDLVLNSAEQLHFTLFLENIFFFQKIDAGKNPSDPDIYCLGCFQLRV